VWGKCDDGRHPARVRNLEAKTTRLTD